MKTNTLTASLLTAGTLFGSFAGLPVHADAAGIHAAVPGSAAATARLFDVCGDWRYPDRAFREAEALLDAGADPNGRDLSTDYTPLMAAAAAGSTDVMELLISRHAHVNDASKSGETALTAAARARNPAAAALLLTHGANVHAVTNDGETALSLAVGMESDDLACAGLLLKRGASPNAYSRSGTPLLATLAGDGNLDAMALLLNYGANPNASRSDGTTPLLQAAMNGRADAVRMLLNRGAAMLDGHGTPFAVLPSGHGWVLLIFQVSGGRDLAAILTVSDDAAAGSAFQPSAAWIASGGAPERLEGKPLRTETAKGWIIAGPEALLKLLKRLAAGNGGFSLRLDAEDGRKISADFDLKGTEDAVKAVLALAGRQEEERK